MKPVITIEVISDVVCPWCYIGKRRLENAVGNLKDQFDFQISYSPFELNPGTPKTGLQQKEYLSKKFGGLEQYQKITDHVSKVAAGEGLHFDFSKQEVSPNTFDAHRIIWMAKAEGKQEAVKEALMKAYFEEGIDLSKTENLVAVASRAGLDKAQVLSMLDSEEGYIDVKQAENLNIQRGVSGVPFYIINNKYGLSGAQPTQVFENALKEIGSMPSAQGETCDVEKNDC